MAENIEFDISDVGVGVDSVGIDQGYTPIEDAPVCGHNPFTPNNGTVTTFVPVDDNTPYTQPVKNENKPEKKERRIWQECAKASLQLGIIGMVGAFIPYLQIITFFCSVIAFFLSFFGKKSRLYRGRSIVGRVFNIIAIPLTILMFAFYATELGLY